MFQCRGPNAASSSSSQSASPDVAGAGGAPRSDGGRSSDSCAVAVGGVGPIAAILRVAARTVKARGACQTKNSQVTSANSGSRMAALNAMKPKKLGMATFASSAMAFTMKFGALPM